nr:flagellar basal body-associated FliL family protein [Nitrospiraceae bacterium]
VERMSKKMPEEKPKEETGEEQAPEKAAKAKTGKKKLLIRLGIIVLAVIVLSGGGFFAYEKFFAAGRHWKKGKKEVHSPAKSVLLPLDPFIVNLSDPGRFLKVSMQLEVDGADNSKILAGMQPQIRDAVITLLGSESTDALSTPEGKVQLKDGIVLRVNQVAGKPMVKNVYFTQFIMQ